MLCSVSSLEQSAYTSEMCYHVCSGSQLALSLLHLWPRWHRQDFPVPNPFSQCALPAQSGTCSGVLWHCISVAGWRHYRPLSLQGPLRPGPQHPIKVSWHTIVLCCCIAACFLLSIIVFVPLLLHLSSPLHVNACFTVAYPLQTSTCQCFIFFMLTAGLTGTATLPTPSLQLSSSSGMKRL